MGHTGPGAWRPKANPWAIAVVVALAAFMEVLDTSIANVALPYMAGSLSATTDQSTWVLTSYLVSNAIVLPMRPGQPATISVDAYGRTYQGRVLNIAGASGARYSLLPPENATGNYVKVVQRIPVKIVFDQGAGRGAPVEDRNVRPAERTNQMTTMRVRLCRGRLTGLLVIAPASAA